MRSTLAVAALACLSLVMPPEAGAPVPPYTPFVAPEPVALVQQQVVDVPRGTPVVTAPIVVEVPKPKTRWVWARVTACSPHDPGDGDYYAAHGYEGATYGIAASPRQFKKGTKIHVPGYMDESYPNKFWAVDSKGGPVIRESARKGVLHIDVKFRTLWSAQQWGTRTMRIEVLAE